jgi:fatty-acyl-CoA synthase
VSAALPVTGSNKVLKRELQQQRWHTEDRVYRWEGRGGAGPGYRLMDEARKRSLDAEFAAHGRQRHL